MRNKVIGVRFGPEDLEKLERLAKQTHDWHGKRGNMSFVIMEAFRRYAKEQLANTD